MVVAFIFLAETRFCPERSGVDAVCLLFCAVAVTEFAPASEAAVCAIAGVAVMPPIKVNRPRACGSREDFCFMRK